MVTWPASTGVVPPPALDVQVAQYIPPSGSVRQASKPDPCRVSVPVYPSLVTDVPPEPHVGRLVIPSRPIVPLLASLRPSTLQVPLAMVREMVRLSEPSPEVHE
jgi:hypothetical protein